MRLEVERWDFFCYFCDPSSSQFFLFFSLFLMPCSFICRFCHSQFSYFLSFQSVRFPIFLFHYSKVSAYPNFLYLYISTSMSLISQSFNFRISNFPKILPLGFTIPRSCIFRDPNFLISLRIKSLIFHFFYFCNP